MSDEYRQRMLAITDELHAQGVGRYTSAPPIYRLAWRFGLHVPPPLYQSFRSLAVGLGISFSVLWGLPMWFLIGRAEAGSIPIAVVASLLAGAFFGPSMGAYYRWKASKLRLPPLDG
jgi:hypothetical protein